jgi:outer membrane receptor protein involved in Fe transport
MHSSRSLSQLPKRADAAGAISGPMFLVGLLLLLFGTVLWAQQTTADVLGTVTDPSSAVLPGVKITVHNLDTAADYTATSDSGGNYRVTLLPVGRYSITALASGFKTWTVPEVTLAIGDRLRQDIHLEVGALEQSVEVTAASPALQADSSSLSNLINTNAMQDLPLNGRNFVVLAQLTAGAAEGEPSGLPSGTRPDDRRLTSAVSVNAQPTSFNNFMIDGMDDNERFIGTVIVKPAVDALQEMKVQTSLYSAEFGRTAGGVINFVTKSGTNEYHGSLFEFFRNQHMDARNFFAGAKPPYHQNQYGGSIGAPIKKNRVFYFADYEGSRVHQGQTFVDTVPTVAERQGNFSGLNAIFDPLSTTTSASGVSTRTRFPGDQIPASQINPIAQTIINLYPVPQTSGLVNNYTYQPLKTQNNDTFDGRVDYRFSDANTAFARYSFNNTNTVLPAGCPPAPNGIDPDCDEGRSGTARQRAQGAQLNDAHVFGPHLVMEVKSGFSRYVVFSLPVNYGKNVSQQVGLTGVNIDNDSSGLSIISIAGLTTLGDASYIPIITINNLFQEVVGFNYLRGAHSVKFGYDLRRRQTDPFQSPTARGQFSFNSNFTNDPSGAVSGSGNSAASFLLGYPASTTRSKYLVSPGLRNWEMAAYVQDDWRATRWLTLNLGFRYDYYGPNSEVANRISNVDLTTGTIIVAGQNGVSSSAGVLPDKLDFSPRFGFAATVSKGTVLRGGYGISFVPNMIASSMALRNPPFVSLYNFNATPLTVANSLSNGLPQPVATSVTNPTGSLNGVAFTGATPYVQQYNLTLQRELPKGMVLTVAYVGALGRRQYIFNGAVNVDLASPGPGTILPRTPYYSVFPNVSSIAIAAPWYNTSYQGLQATLEHRYQNGLSLLGTYTWSHSLDDEPSILNNPQTEYGNSFLDLRHRFTLLADYTMPFAKGAKGPAAMLAKGWGIQGVVVLTTGIPFDITNASGRSNTGGGDRPNVVGDPNSGFTQSIYEWFNTAAFALQPLYTYGNLGRNVLHAPGRKDLDLAIHREFIPREGLHLQFRAEAFNLTNTPPFAAPGGSFGSATFGVISSAGLGRNIQLALKLLF